MVSNRLIALALVAALVQAWTLSFRLAAAAAEADEKKGAAAPSPLSDAEKPQQFAWYCKADEEQTWSLRDQAALQLSVPTSSLLDVF